MTALAPNPPTTTDPRNSLTRPGAGLGRLVWYQDRPYRVMTLAARHSDPTIYVTLGHPDHVTGTGTSDLPAAHVDVPLVDIETQPDRAARLAQEIRSW